MGRSTFAADVAEGGTTSGRRGSNVRRSRKLQKALFFRTRSWTAWEVQATLMRSASDRRERTWQVTSSGSLSKIEGSAMARASIGSNKDKNERERNKRTNERRTAVIPRKGRRKKKKNRKEEKKREQRSKMR